MGDRWLMGDFSTSVLAFAGFLALSPATSSQVRLPSVPVGLADAVWAAISPALPYPAAAADDQPENGRAEPEWAVRRLHEEPAVAEVVANPLNAENQARAARAMTAILEAVAAAERRAQEEFERLQSRRSRENAEMRGISLADEGVAGERADWNARLIVETRASAGPYEFSMPGDLAPALIAAPAGVAALVVAKPTEYDETAENEARRRRYRPAEARVYIGRVSIPRIERSENAHQVRVTRDASFAGQSASVEVRLRGNEELVRQVIEKADWTRIGALLR